MKAVVLEIKDGMSAALKEDGTVVKVSRVYEVGETIDIADAPEGVWQRFNSLPNAKWIVRTAAMLLICLVLGGIYSYNNVFAYSYVTVEAGAKAQMELLLNRNSNVISAEALNEPAQPLVEEMLSTGIRKQSISSAAVIMSDVIVKSGVVDEEKEILFSVASGNDGAAETLRSQVETSMKESLPEDIVTESYVVSRQEMQSAISEGVSPARYKKNIIAETDIETSESDTETDTETGTETESDTETDTETSESESDTETSVETETSSETVSTEGVGGESAAPETQSASDQSGGENSGQSSQEQAPASEAPADNSSGEGGN